MNNIYSLIALATANNTVRVYAVLYLVLSKDKPHLHRLDERNQSKGPEAAEKGEEGETEVVFSRRPGLQRDKIYVFVHTRSIV